MKRVIKEGREEKMERVKKRAIKEEKWRRKKKRKNKADRDN